jgi:hypothetical protein
VEAVLEEMTARMDVFEGKLDKMATCLGKTKIETSQKPREAESKTHTKEMEATASEADQEEKEAAILEHQNINLRISNWRQYTRTQRKLRIMLYE